VISSIYEIRPKTFPPNIPPETFHEWWVNWLQRRLSPVMPNDIMTQLDYAHLVSVSCITYDYVGTRDLKKILSPPENSGFQWDYNRFIQDTEVGRKLKELWDSGMTRAVSTSVGRLIGIYVNDLLVGTKTTIEWD
jgi:hypothetical protein